VGLGFGHIRSDSFTTGSIFQFDVQTDLYLTRAFGVGLRYRYLHAQTDGDRESLTLHPVSAGLRLRIFNDEADREAWIFEPEGGYAFVGGGRAEGGPFAGLTIARNFGNFISEGGSANGALTLSALQGLGSMVDVRIITVGLRLAPSFNAFAPHNVDVPRRATRLHFTVGAKWYMLGGRWGTTDAFALSPGGAITFGLPVTRWLEPIVQADVTYFQPLQRDGASPLAYAFLGGLRIRMNGFAPLYLSGLAGWQVVSGRAPLAFGDGALFDAGFGFNGAMCGGSIQLGVHYRRGFSHEAENFNAVMFVVGATLGSRAGSVGEGPLDHVRPYRCSPPSVARAPLPPPPPRPPPPPPPPPTFVPPRVDLRVEVPRVTVAAEPVEVSVPIGAVLFGGLVRFQVNVSALPIDRLVRAGWVTVRVEGPPDVLPQATAEIRAALDARGVAVQGYAMAAIPGASEVRAVFTLWPPGTRPPGR
jgi:hypothetical protein